MMLPTKIPTRQKGGWLYFLFGWIIFTLISNLLGGPFFLDLIALVFLVALIIEVVANLLGKNKSGQ